MNNLTSPLPFILAGNATFTIQSKRSGKHFTYTIRQRHEDQPHFVSVLINFNGHSFFKYLGTIFNERNYHHGKKSEIGKNAPSEIAFRWAWQHILNDDLDQMTIYHIGYCGRCGKELTNPESIENGIGPVCIKKMQ